MDSVQNVHELQYCLRTKHWAFLFSRPRSGAAEGGAPSHSGVWRWRLCQSWKQGERCTVSSLYEDQRVSNIFLLCPFLDGFHHIEFDWCVCLMSITCFIFFPVESVHFFYIWINLANLNLTCPASIKALLCGYCSQMYQINVFCFTSHPSFDTPLI